LSRYYWLTLPAKQATARRAGSPQKDWYYPEGAERWAGQAGAIYTAGKKGCPVDYHGGNLSKSRAFSFKPGTNYFGRRKQLKGVRGTGVTNFKVSFA
jgi:hypothetical protein